MNGITIETRQESLLKLDKQTRYNLILECLKDHQNGLTAREIAYKLGYTERNATAPRLTELVAMNKIIVSGKHYDEITKTKVTVYKLNREDTVKHIIINGQDMGYAHKCENCSFGLEERNEKGKRAGYWCKKLKGSLSLTLYKKKTTCLWFEKKT